MHSAEAHAAAAVRRTPAEVGVAQPPPPPIHYRLPFPGHPSLSSPPNDVLDSGTHIHTYPLKPLRRLDPPSLYVATQGRIQV
jgi:hypothetical protein